MRSYYLMRGGVYGSDVPYAEESLMLMHNADLADTLGNLIHRAASLSQRMCSGVVPDVQADVIFDVARLRRGTEEAFASFALQVRRVQPACGDVSHTPVDRRLTPVLGRRRLASWQSMP
jgi:methionyl-tRNA synthetase